MSVNLYIVVGFAMLAGLALMADAQIYETCSNAIKGGGECENDGHCGGADAGACVNATCVCTENYFAEYCDYKARDSYTAGLVGLTLLASIGGVTALYLGNLTWGIPQLILTVAPSIVACILCNKKIKNGGLIGLTTAAMWTWALATTIIFGARTLPYSACDGNGYPIINNVNGDY